MLTHVPFSLFSVSLPLSRNTHRMMVEEYASQLLPLQPWITPPSLPTRLSSGTSAMPPPPSTSPPALREPTFSRINPSRITLNAGTVRTNAPAEPTREAPITAPGSADATTLACFAPQGPFATTLELAPLHRVPPALMVTPMASLPLHARANVLPGTTARAARRTTPQPVARRAATGVR